MSPKTLVGVSGVAAILFLMAACSSQMLTATPSASPETAGVAPSAPLPEPYPAVLARWNYYRASVGIPPIVVDPALNQAALHHAKYLVTITSRQETARSATDGWWRRDGTSARIPSRWVINGTPRTALSGQTTPTSFAARPSLPMARRWLTRKPQDSIRSWCLTRSWRRWALESIAPTMTAPASSSINTA